MSKKIWSVLLTGALIAGVLYTLPAFAQTEVPATVQIEDPAEDANYLNDQGLSGTPAGPQGDNPGGVYVGAGDILKVWFTNTADTLSSHILTSFPPPNSRFGIIYRVMVNPGEDSSSGCIWFQGIVPSGTYVGEQEANIRWLCEDKEPTKGELTIEALGEGDDAQGLVTLTYPRSESSAFADGSTLTAPQASTRNIWGPLPLPATPVTGANPAPTAPQMDNTKIGTDYTIQSGEPDPSGSPTTAPPPPDKQDPPEKKNKKCKKGSKKAQKKCKKKNKKNKKNKKPKAPEAPVCAPYVPGEAGTEAETTVVTDAATAEAPIEIEIETHEGLGAGRNPETFGRFVSHAFHNAQVDTANPEAGLWASIEFTEVWDYDLYMDLADGTNVAESAGIFNEGDGDDADSQTDFGSETITGVKSPDCQGYTLDIVGATTPGETITLKLWLGEIVYTFEPQLVYDSAVTIF